MEAPRNFKLDVRIRSRLLSKGQVTEAEVAKHLEGLADVEAQCDIVTLSQPAIGIPPERPRPMPRPVQPKPLARPVVNVDAVDEAWDDEDDDEEEEVKPKKAAPVVSARPGKVEIEGEPKAASSDDDEDDLVSDEDEEGDASEDEE